MGNANRRPATPPLGDRSEFLARQRALSASIDLAALEFPIIAINGEYDRPYSKTHRLWREARNFTSVVLPGKGHLSAIMRGFIPQEYVDAMVAFITTNNPLRAAPDWAGPARSEDRAQVRVGMARASATGA